MNILYTYIPQDRLRALAHGEDLPTHTSGSALFADISGFTPLTRAFAEAFGPKRGAEALLGVLNPLFEALIEPVHRFGGSVIGFAGDAITCWFEASPRHPEPSLYHSSLRATAVALAMQSVMKPFAAVHAPDGSLVTLSIKVAIAAGSARRFMVGDPAIQQMDTLAGITLSRMAEAEKYASQGEVVVSGEVAESLKDVLNVSAWRDEQRYAVVDGLKVEVQAEPWPMLTEDALSEVQVRQWVLPFIFEQLNSGVVNLGDLRPVTPLMVQFEGIDFDADENAGSKLDSFVSWSQRIVHQYGGSLIQLTIGDKGAFMYAVFGAPLAHENDPTRALQAALALRDMPVDLAAYLKPLRIGLTYGMAWTGNYGGYERFTYGVISSEVNLSARLMGKAEPGQILVSGRMGQYPGFRFEHVGNLIFKGFDTPLPTYSLLGEQVSDAQAFQTAMVGRDDELEKLATFAQPLFANHLAGVAIVYGEPGIGKSRLAYALHQMFGERVSWFTGQTDQILSQAFNPFIYWLKRYFDQSPNASMEQNKVNFESRLDQLGDSLQALTVSPHSPISNLQSELIRTRSFLGALLGFDWPDSLYAQLDSPKLRYENTLIAIKTLLLAESQLRPVVFELEDGHWLDDPSREMLLAISRNVAAYPLLVLITSRYNDDGSQPVFALDREIPILKLDLEALTREALERQAASVLGGKISPALLALLWERSRANPFFAEQMLLHFHETGILIQTQMGEWEFQSSPVTLSIDVHTMLVARIDRLTHKVRQVVQAAAVLGIEFDVQLLSKMLHTDALPEVQDAERGQIWQLMRELRYIFKHALLRDAAYDMQLRSRLRELHHLAAVTAEQVYADQLSSYYDILAYHYRMAYQLGVENVSERACHYLRKAGESAQKNFANSVALDYYNQLLPMLQDLSEQAQVYLQRGAVLELIGRWPEAENDYRTALDLVDGNTGMQAGAQLALGKLFHLRGDFSPALKWFEQAKMTWTTLQDQAGLSQTLIATGFVLWRKGDLQDARRYLEEGLTLARMLHDQPGVALALEGLGRVAHVQDDYAVSQALHTESLSLRRELGDKQGIAWSLNYLGIVAAGQGDYVVAQALFEESLALFRDLGDKFGIAEVLEKLGITMRFRGEWGKARVFYEESLDISREIGDRSSTAWVLYNLGAVAHSQKEYETARALLEEGLVHFRELGHKAGIAWVLSFLGKPLTNLQQFNAARAAFREALVVFQQLQSTIGVIFSVEGVVNLSIAQGQLEESAQLIAWATAARESINNPRPVGEQEETDLALANLRTALGEDTFHTAWMEGGRMTMEEAIQLALHDVP